MGFQQLKKNSFKTVLIGLGKSLWKVSNQVCKTFLKGFRRFLRVVDIPIDNVLTTEK